MVKVIIEMDGEQDKVLSGKFANVMTASDVGVRYKAYSGIFGEIEPGELPNVLAQATAETMRRAYKNPKDRIAAMFRISKLFQGVLLDEITENKERLELSEGAKELLDLAIAVKEGCAMATKTLISLGRHPVNSLQVGQMIRFQSRCFVQEMVLTIRRLQWLKDKVIISGDEANDVALSVYDWVELVQEEKEAV